MFYVWHAPLDWLTDFVTDRMQDGVKEPTDDRQDSVVTNQVGVHSTLSLACPTAPNTRVILTATPGRLRHLAASGSGPSTTNEVSLPSP